MDWTEKYRPAHLREIIGNSPAVREMFEWARSWSPRSKPLILYGKSGTGKTSAAYALARELGWDVIELNASDQRTRAVIERVAGTGSTSGSLSGHSHRLIVLDEADQLQGSADYGGARAIIAVLGAARQPIILIANSLYDLPAEIRNRGQPVQFRAIQTRSIVPRLRDICHEEQIQCEDEALRAVAENSSGDMRAAVMALYASALGRTRIDKSQVRTSGKDNRVSIFELIMALFGKRTDEELLRASRETDETPDTVIQWIEANVSLIPDPIMRCTALRHLSRADLFIGSTYRQQYYTLWRYATTEMVLGFAAAAGGMGVHARITPPPRWQRMATLRRARGTRMSTLATLSMRLHIPHQQLRERYMHLIGEMIEQDPVGYAEALSLGQDELELLLHDKARAAAAIKEIARKKKREETRSRENIPTPRKEPDKTEERVEHPPTEGQRDRTSGNQSTLNGF
jgi:replication factor C large subunit